MCTVLLPPGGYPVAFNKYIDIVLHKSNNLMLKCISLIVKIPDFMGFFKQIKFRLLKPIKCFVNFHCCLGQILRLLI
jgi:hypothetical protein